MAERLTYVPQRGAEDCGVASVAMVTGLTYEQVAEQLPEPVGAIALENWLADNGWALARKWYGGVDGKPRAAWPPTVPFAPVPHLAEVTATGYAAHLVAIDADGTFLDPWDRGRTGWDAYVKVHWVAALIRLPVSPSSNGAGS